MGAVRVYQGDNEALDFAAHVARVLNTMTDEGRERFFDAVGANFCFACGSTAGHRCHCQNDE